MYITLVLVFSMYEVPIYMENASTYVIRRGAGDAGMRLGPSYVRITCLLRIPQWSRPAALSRRGASDPNRCSHVSVRELFAIRHNLNQLGSEHPKTQEASTANERAAASQHRAGAAIRLHRRVDSAWPAQRKDEHSLPRQRRPQRRRRQRCYGRQRPAIEAQPGGAGRSRYGRV